MSAPTAIERLDVWGAIAQLPFCMLTTSTGAALRSRPMAPIIDAEHREIRFLTRLSSHKIHEIAEDAQVNLAFFDPHGHAFISVSGRAAVVREPAQIAALWNKDADLWFPEGPHGADVALVRVMVQSAERWDRSPEHNTYAWISFTPV